MPVNNHLKDKSDPIIIIGAGVFGLSTSLHLAERGYTNVKVFDKQDYHRTKYSYLDGCDAASADLNKIIRTSYGTEMEYRDMGKEAIGYWKSWNEEVSSGKTLPEGMKKGERIFWNNGYLSMNDGTELLPFEKATLEGMKRAGLVKDQLCTRNERDVEEIKRLGKGYALDPFKRNEKGKPTIGLLDAGGGMVAADRACRFAMKKAQDLGVQFILGGDAGTFDSLIVDPTAPRVRGIRTADGQMHVCYMITFACGGWTPSLLTSLDGLCETTAGSVAMMQLPRGSELHKKFSPDRFPAWSYKMHEGASGGLYGFPCDDNGIMKIGYRGTKYTNPQRQEDGKERSIPVTQWTKPETEDRLPKQALSVIKPFIREFLPELVNAGIKISASRLCWYTDSFDNHYVIDWAPSYDNVLVATGGSGHAFKMLPNLGKYVVDVVEGKNLDKAPIRKWKWRSLPRDQEPFNKLMEGSAGARARNNIRWSEEWTLEEQAMARL